MSDAWNTLTALVGEIDALTGTLGVLEWDQQVMMPRGGAEARGAQLALLSRLLHDRMTDPRLSEALAALSGETDPVRAAAVRNLRRRTDRARRVPSRLAEAQALASSQGFAAWMAAREAGSFAPFQPALERLVGLSQELIACFGPADHPYDHLLQDYDPGASTAEISATFDRLEAELVPFVASLDGGKAPAAVQIRCTEDQAMAVSRAVSAALGYRYDDGRLDLSQHPFTVGLHPGDVRITTHAYPEQLTNTLWGTVHETGHALYEQGLPVALRGTGLCEAASTGIHESQSRFWENFIARSLPFARWITPLLRQHLPGLELTPEQLYGHSNRVTRSLIRVHADEATYNLHILVRFGLERRLVEGSLAVADLPEAWDAAYEQMLGIRPPRLVEGVLQDVHWSNGLFGYFPSYTLGNLYAASFAATLESALPDLWAQVEAGDFAPILAWLRENIHQHGHLYDAPELFQRVTGGRDTVADFMAHLRGRQGALYGV